MENQEIKELILQLEKCLGLLKKNTVQKDRLGLFLKFKEIYMSIQKKA